MAKKKKRNKRPQISATKPALQIKAFHPVPNRLAFAVAGTKGTVPFGYTAWQDAERVLEHMIEHTRSSFWDMIVSVTKPSELRWLQTANGVWRGEM